MGGVVVALSAKERAVAVNRAREESYFFSRWMMRERFRTQWIKGPHHQIIADTLMRVYHGELDRVIFNLPPRYGKTREVTDWVAWCLGQVPDAEFIYTSYSSELAEENSRGTRDLADSGECREVFPHLLLRHDSSARHHWRTTEGGVVYAAGSGGTITGFGAGKAGRETFGGAIIIDDPLKPDEAYSDPYREGVIRWYQNTLASRTNNSRTPIIVIMQRLHERDLAGWLLDGGTGEKWHHVCFPAIQPDGTALWPEKHTIEVLRVKQEADPHGFAGQYQQQPRPPGGAFFEERMLLVPSSVLGPDGKPILEPVEMPKVLNYVFAVIDTAIKTGQQHDGTGVVFFGRSKNLGGHPLTVLDWDYQQIQGASLEKWLPTVFERLEQLARECHAVQGSQGAWIEDKNSGSILLQKVTDNGWPAREIDSKLTAMGKEGRGMAASPHISPGHVKIARPAYVKKIPFKGMLKNHFLSQVLDFRMGAKSNSADDLFDCMTYGTVIALGGPTGM